MESYEQRVYWNKKSYGKAIRLTRKKAILILISICLITPATNWLIPFSKKIIKNDFVWRYE